MWLLKGKKFFIFVLSKKPPIPNLVAHGSFTYVARKLQEITSLAQKMK